jgi:uncharacterized protein YfaS (alpha-2-macroglobulin family)
MTTQKRTPRWLVGAVVVVVIATLIGGGVALRSTTSTVNAAPASILGWSPGVARGLPLTAPLTVYFSRGMDHASVERAWHITPAVRGTFAWSDTAVTFHPSHPLKPGTYYRFSLGSGARDDQGKAVRNRLAAAFTTGDPLKVLTFTPAAGTIGVPANGLIAITFNHAMVGLTGLNVRTPNPPGWKIGISPQTPGHGSWLGTSTWVFHPDAGLVPSSAYTVTVPGSVGDAWGEQLRRTLTWHFHTVTPEIVATTPDSGATGANPDGTVSVVFNQLMDHASTEAAFSLHAGSTIVTGSTTWNRNILVFHPATALDSTKTYQGTVAASARSATGAATLSLPRTWTFQVAAPPHVAHSTPSPNATSAPTAVQLYFNAPMNKDSLDHRLTVSPTVPNMSTYIYGSKTPNGSDVYNISGDFKPSTAYTVTIDSGARDLYGRPVPTPYSLHFTTAPLAPSVVLFGFAGTSGVSFSAGRVVHAPAQLVNVDRVRYTLVRTSLADTPNFFQYGGRLAVPPGTVIRTWSQPVSAAQNELKNVEVTLAGTDGSPLAPGLYWLGAEGPGSSTSMPSSDELVAATNVSVTLKTDARGALVWVTSARTGQPLAGAAVQLVGQNGKSIASGQTDQRGLSLFRGVAQSNLSAAVVDDGTHFGLAMTSWQAASRTGYNAFGPGNPCCLIPTGSYVYTDRPIYRPGQQVHFRAVLWKDRDGVYRRFGPRPVTAQATDAAGHQVYKATLHLDRFGTVHGHFVLPANGATGGSSISLTAPGINANGYFAVAAYRKPEFLTTITTPKTNYAQGETIDAAVSVRYVFGAPVAGQQVSWTLYRQSQFGTPPGAEQYQFGDQDAIQLYFSAQAPYTSSGPLGQIVKQGAGTTDARGQLHIRVPVDLAGVPLDQTLTIEATTTDINHQSVSGRVQITAHRAALGVGIATQQAVAAGQQDTIDLLAVHPDGSPAANQSLTVTVSRRTYTSQLADNGYGSGYWKQVPHDTAFTQQQVTADARGKASISFTPDKGGSYYVLAKTKDNLGNTARSGVSVYAGATGVSNWGLSSNTAISVKPDRTSYRVGQTARLVVASPFPDATALVTVERGSIRAYSVQHLPTNSSVISVPVSLDDLPNVYVTVTLYRGWRNGSPPDWRSGTAELHVGVNPRRVIVHLAQNRTHYHPGDQVTYTVHTADTRGRPVAAQLSLALVDTAVLALQPDATPNIIDAFYTEQPLQVSTASDGVLSIDHVQQLPGFAVHPPGGFGGGGGGGPAPATGGLPSDQTHVRHHFADTAFWTATARTNAAGRVTVRVTLPDNLTTWRLQARAVTTNQQVGEATLQTVSTQDIIIRPVTPRFLVQGDTVRLGAVVNNNLNRAASVKLSLAATGLGIPAGAQSITVPANGERLVLWSATVPETLSARLTYRALPSSAGIQGDAIRVTLPVDPPLTDETVTTAGQVFGSEQQMVMVPSGARSRPGALTVEISSSLTAGLGKALASLQPTPYDSNDDIASRTLAAQSVERAPASSTGLRAPARARLAAMVNTGVTKLLSRQLGDGGWPWFNGPSAQSDTTITADVVEALDSVGTGDARFAQALAAARTYLQTNLPNVLPPERAHLLGVLGSSARLADAQALAADAPVRTHLDAASLADLALALYASGDAEGARSLVAALDSTAMVSATGAHWEGLAQSGVPAVQATARVLSTLLRIAPSDPFVVASARWLMLARQGTQWDSPHDTAVALKALSTYARTAREGRSAYHYTVSIDGTPRLTGPAAPRQRTISVPINTLHRGSGSRLTITRDPQQGNIKPGTLYYVAQLRYFLPANRVAARDQGLSITRRYLDLHGKPIATAPAGSLVQVELTLSTSQTLNHLDVEDPIPAGFEPVDQSLNTSQQGLFPGWHVSHAGASDLDGYLIHTDLRDDRVSLYALSIPPGTYVYSYLAQATVSGHYAVAPTRAGETFFPEVFGRSAGQTFTVGQP